jgi:hypothetical protein
MAMGRDDPMAVVLLGRILLAKEPETMPKKYVVRLTPPSFVTGAARVFDLCGTFDRRVVEKRATVPDPQTEYAAIVRALRADWDSVAQDMHHAACKVAKTECLAFEEPLVHEDPFAHNDEFPPKQLSPKPALTPAPKHNAKKTVGRAVVRNEN